MVTRAEVEAMGLSRDSDGNLRDDVIITDPEVIRIRQEIERERDEANAVQKI